MTYELPGDIGALSADDLADHLTQVTEEFQTLRNSEELTDADVPKLEALAQAHRELSAEHGKRAESAAEALAKIDALSAEVLGENGSTEETEEEAEEETPVAEEVSASATRGTVRLNAVRPRVANTALVVPETVTPPKRLTEFTAAADIAGHRPGSSIDLKTVVPAMVARAQSLASGGGSTGLVASYSHPFPEELIVNDIGNADEGHKVSQYAASQRRLQGGDLVAAGGWCAPSETMYDFLNLSCPDMLWDAPEIQLRRGGLRFFPTPVLDVAAMTFLHTEAADIAGTPKLCYTPDCPDPIEVRCDAIGVCFRAGLLTQRHFPEFIESQLALAMTAQEIRIRQVLLNQLAASATAVPLLEATFGTLSAVYSAVALQAADIIERFSLCDNIALEVVFPWWSRNMMLADVARRNGVPVDEVTTADVQAIFTPLGVRIQWARGIVDAAFPQDNDPANNVIGGTTPAIAWPATVQFLIYPAGQVQIGRGAEINLGVVYDHASLTQNLATFAFTEECSTIVNRAPAGSVRLVTVPVCADGRTGEQAPVACPAP